MGTPKADTQVDTTKGDRPDTLRPDTGKRTRDTGTGTNSRTNSRTDCNKDRSSRRNTQSGNRPTTQTQGLVSGGTRSTDDRSDMETAGNIDMTAGHTDRAPRANRSHAALRVRRPRREVWRTDATSRRNTIEAQRSLLAGIRKRAALRHA